MFFFVSLAPALEARRQRGHDSLQHCLCQGMEEDDFMLHSVRSSQSPGHPEIRPLPILPGTYLRIYTLKKAISNIFFCAFPSRETLKNRNLHFAPCLSEVSLRVVHGAVGMYSGVKARLAQHRNITMQSVSTRRAPNCFNLIRQVEILQQSGHKQDISEF